MIILDWFAQKKNRGISRREKRNKLLTQGRKLLGLPYCTEKYIKLEKPNLFIVGISLTLKELELLIICFWAKTKCWLFL